MHLFRSLVLLCALASFAAAAEKSPTPRWSEEPKTPAAAAWLARRIVAAQVNDQPEVAQSLAEMLRAAEVAPLCAEGGVFFFAQRGPGEKQTSIYRRQRWEGKDERLIDAATRGKKNLTLAAVSTNGRLLAYGMAEGKGEERMIRIFDVKEGRDLLDVLPAARYHTVSFGPKNTGVYYARVRPEGTRIFFHPLGEETSADKYIFGESYFYVPLGPKDAISTEVTKNGRYSILSVRRGGEAKRVDIYAQELEQPDEKIRSIIFGMDQHFSFASRGRDLYVLTDHEAPRQRVVKVAIDDPSPLQWQELVPQSEETLTELEIMGDRLFVSGERDGVTRTRIFNFDGKETGEIVAPATASPLRVQYVCEADHDDAPETEEGD